MSEGNFTMKSAPKPILSLAALVALAVVTDPFAGSAHAQDAEVEALIKPDKEIQFSVGGVLDDARRFGMYSGMRNNSAYGYIDANLNWRNEDDGTWVRIIGRNVGLESGDLRVEHEKQGSWRYFLEAGRTVQYNPNIITSGLNGVGTNSQQVSGAGLRDLDLSTHRDQIKFGYERQLGYGFSSKLSGRHEEKQGERQWGAEGYNFITEPIYFQTTEVEGTLAYTGTTLQLQAGYLGSFFRNNDEVVYANTASANSRGPISLAPDNQAHQLFLAGGYNFTPSTRGNFKVSYTHNKQDEDFFIAADGPTAKFRSGLGGEVHTLVAQANLAARPIDKLTTNLKLRAEDRNDVTDRALYRTPSASLSGMNALASHTIYSGDFEAGYQLPFDFKILGGAGYEYRDRFVPPIRSLGYRETTEEVSERIELRRQITDNLGGSIAYIHSERNGSDYFNSSDSYTSKTARVAAILWADRVRDKLRANFDWTPINSLSSQLTLEGSKDSYTGRILGPRYGDSLFASLDLTYKLARGWDLTGWASIEQTRIDQSTNGDGYSKGTTLDLTNVDWNAKLTNLGRAIGLGLRGQVTSAIKIGADTEYTNDVNRHELSLAAPLSAGFGVTDLPDIKYDQYSVRLFSEYEFIPNNSLRLRYNYAHLTARDWTWQKWAYADGSSVRIPDSQDVHFIGLSYFLKW